MAVVVVAVGSCGRRGVRVGVVVEGEMVRGRGKERKEKGRRRINKHKQTRKKEALLWTAKPCITTTREKE